MAVYRSTNRPPSASIRIATLFVALAGLVFVGCGTSSEGGSGGFGESNRSLTNNADAFMQDAAPTFGSDANAGANSDSGADKAEDDASNSGDNDASAAANADTSDTESNAADTTVPAGNCPGALGCSCETAKDCDSKVCVEVQSQKICVPACAPTTPPEEICDGQDNDCNGKIDDGDLCGDGDLCTANVCSEGKCSNPPTTCDDNNACTKDSCDANTGCDHEVVASMCDDNNPCTDDVCDLAKGCTATAKVCDDNNPCTKDSCDLAVGCTGTEVGCDDNNPCTEDSCVPSTGQCDHSIGGNGTACDDGNLCTLNDACFNGSCSSGAAKPCDSGNVCVDSACFAKSGECVETIKQDGASCSDDSACTESDACKGGACNGTKVVCDDKKVCTADSCDPKKGCVHAPGNVGTPCDDGDACTSGDVCAKDGDGVGCKGPKATKCDDGQPCTADTCNKVTGKCSHGPAKSGTPCNDNSFCTLSDKCVVSGGKVVCKGSPIPCKDSDPCTNDGCNAKTGACVFTPGNTGQKCDDGNVCTTGEVCKSVGGKGVCSGGKAKNCNDNKPCTADSCDAKSGKCIHGPAKNGTKCDDGDKCTSGDVCGSGACVGAHKNCDDGKVCTDDSCVKTTGTCKNVAISGCDPNKCLAYDVRYGNEEETPKYTTSSEYLFGVSGNPKGGSYAAGYVHGGTGPGYQGLVVRRDDAGKRVWAKQYGRTGKSDFLRSVVTLSDGTAVVVGNRAPASGSYYVGWAMRVSSTGSTVWTKDVGGTYYDYLYDVERYGSGVVACGYRRLSSSSSQKYRPWLMYMNTSGTLTGLKERLLPQGADNTYIYGCGVDNKTGTVILAGAQYKSGKSNEGYLATVSKTGVTKNLVIAGSTSTDMLRDVVSLENGLIAAAGYSYTNSTTYYDGWLLRASLSLTGMTSWKYGSVSKKHDYFHDIAAISGSRVVVGGYYGNGQSSTYDGWVMQVDTNSGKVSGYNVKHGSTKSDYVYSVATDVGGHVLAAGRTYGGTNGDTWQMRLSPAGQTTCGGPGGGTCDLYSERYGNELETPKYTTSSEFLYGVAKATSGGGALAVGAVYTGTSQGYNGLAIRRDDKGKRVWAKQFHRGSSDYFHGLVASSDGGGIAAGYAYGSTTSHRDGWFLRFNSAGTQVWNKTYGSTTWNDFIYDAAPNGAGIVGCGYRRPTNGSTKYRPWVVWLNSSGNKTGLGERTVSMSGNDVYTRGCDVDKNGTVFLAGYQSVTSKGFEGVLVSVSKTGATKSVVIPGGTSSDLLRDVVALDNGWIAAVGYRYVNSTTSNEGWLVRALTSLGGVAQWTIGTESKKSDLLFSVAKTSGSSVTAAGYSQETSGTGIDGWVISLNPLTGQKLGLNKKIGTVGKTDSFEAIAPNGDGKWLLAGRSHASSTVDTWMAKVSSDGQTTCNSGGGTGTCKYWDLKSGLADPTSTSNDSFEYTWGIKATKDGSIQAGYARQSTNGYQGVAQKRDTFGKVMWLRKFGGSSSDYLRDVAPHTDGTSWLAGYTYSSSKGSADGWLIRLDNNGKTLKEVRVGGSKFDAFYSADTDGKGGVLVAGYRDLGTGNGNDGWIAWYNSAGVQTSWKEKVFGGSGSQYLFGVDYDPKSGQTFAAGYKYVSGKSSEAWLVRVTNGGTQVLSRTWSGTGSEVLYGVKVHPTYGYVYGVGYSTSGSAGGADAFIVRATNSFTSPTQRMIGTAKSEYFYDVSMAAVGTNLVGVGYSHGAATNSNDGWLREFSWASLAATGTQQWYGVKSASDYFYGVDATPAGYVIGGRSNAKSGDTDTWALSVDAKGAITCK